MNEAKRKALEYYWSVSSLRILTTLEEYLDVHLRGESHLSKVIDIAIEETKRSLNATKVPLEEK